MKKFIFQFFRVIFLFWFFSFLITIIIYNSSNKNFYTDYELPPIISKLNIYKTEPTILNTLFIGSSLTYRQIIPSLFDSITGNSSFNLGFESLFPYRSYDVLDRALGMKRSSSIENVFIELAPPDFIAENYDNSAFIYSINFKRYFESMQTVFNPNLSLAAKFYIFKYWNLCFLYKYSGFSVSKYCKLIFCGPDKKDLANKKLENLIMETKGYVDLNTQEEKLNGSISKNRKDFITKGNQINAGLIKKYKNTFKKTNSVDAFTSYVINRAGQLKQKGLNVYFIIPPRKLVFINYSLYQKSFLEHNGFHVLDLSSPVLYPQFYDYNFSFNETHLNAKGAILYTRDLASAYEKAKK